MLLTHRRKPPAQGRRFDLEAMSQRAVNETDGR
jgi:hypothetical protein